MTGGMTGAPASATQIRLVYPHPEQPVYEDSTFLLGSVTGFPSGSHLRLDAHETAGITIPLSPQGFFAWKIPLHPGMNPVLLQVRVATSTAPVAETAFALYRVPPLEVLPPLPLAIHEDTLQPNEDVWLLPEDVLTVACSASIGAQVSLLIPGVPALPSLPLSPLQSDAPYLDTREMIFAQPHWTERRIPTQGYYRAQVRLSDWLDGRKTEKPLENLPLVLRVQHGEAYLEQPLPGRLSILQKPRFAMVREDRAVTRTAPVRGARLTPQRAGTQVAVDGLEQGWARIRLAQDTRCYLPLADLSFSEMQAPKPLSLSHIRMEQAAPHTSLIRLAFYDSPTHACPIQVETLPAEPAPAGANEPPIRPCRLLARLYGVRSCCDFIQYPPGHAAIGQIHWRQLAEDTLEIWIDSHAPLTGYDMEWGDGEWRLRLKHLPERLQDIRILIDPGHGGTESGAVGLNGLPEKTMNLDLSLLLRDALWREGLQVTLTRTEDQTVSLPERGQQVLVDDADIVLSIHHNALPDGRDPLQAQGASTFYYHPFAQSLAAALLNGLARKGDDLQFGIPNYGLFYDSLYMTRIHQAMAVLVEVGFVTHPEEFERLIRPDFQREAAQRLAQSLVSWLRRALFGA